MIFILVISLLLNIMLAALIWAQRRSIVELEECIDTLDEDRHELYDDISDLKKQLGSAQRPYDRHVLAGDETRLRLLDTMSTDD